MPPWRLEDLPGKDHGGREHQRKRQIRLHSSNFGMIGARIEPSERTLTADSTCRKASLCGHYEVVQLLLESGALCERDTFQGERCLYNALNDRIRNLLLSYDYSKSTNPLQPLAAHITSLLTREHPKTQDLSLICGNDIFHTHKFILSARSPYFWKKLSQTPDITSFRLPNTLPIDSIISAIRFLYFGEISADLGDDQDEKEILEGIGKFSRQIESERIF